MGLRSRLGEPQRTGYEVANELKPGQTLEQKANEVSAAQQPTQTEQEKRVKKVQDVGELVDTGLKKGKELVGEGSLGRLSTSVNTVGTKLDESQSADTQDILARRRAALGGLSQEEMSAQRGQASEQFGRNEETNRRRLASIQAGLGVRGDTAATQQSQQLSAGQQQRTNFERDMILANRQIQDQALSAFDSSVRGAEAQQQNARMGNIQVEQFNAGQMLKQRELEKFNLQQTARERFGQIGVAFGMAQSVMADESQQRAVETQLKAAALQGGDSGGLSLTCTELHRQGLMDDYTYAIDAEFGKLVQIYSPVTYIGYASWAKYLIPLMRKSFIITKMVSLIVLPWAKYMAHGNSRFGKFIHTIGVKFCNMVGSIITKGWK